MIRHVFILNYYLIDWHIINSNVRTNVYMYIYLSLCELYLIFFKVVKRSATKSSCKRPWGESCAKCHGRTEHFEGRSEERGRRCTRLSLLRGGAFKKCRKYFKIGHDTSVTNGQRGCERRGRLKRFFRI